MILNLPDQHGIKLPVATYKPIPFGSRLGYMSMLERTLGSIGVVRLSYIFCRTKGAGQFGLVVFTGRVFCGLHH